MIRTRRAFLKGTTAAAASLALPGPALATGHAFTINAPMDPPEWALLERELLHAHTAACVTFFQRYFDPSNGWLETTVRFGGDAVLKLIKSLMNGSSGPKLRKATPLDWTGDPIDVKTRFPSLGHGEDDYQMMLRHFVGYEDVVGDHPLNLVATTLPTNAYLLTHERKYKDWVPGYCDAWAERARANDGIIPSNAGLDGAIGGAADGKWYGGTYGWGLSPVVPMTGKRSDRNRVPRCIVGFFNAYLLSKGDDKYLNVWRKTADGIDANAKLEDGKPSSPTMYGDKGWYGFQPGKYRYNFLEIYHLSMNPSDRARCEETGWYEFLEGKNPGYPVKALREGLSRIAKQMEIVNADSTSPDMRLAPGAGARLNIKMKRFANDPALSFPWEDTVADLGDPPI
jgi:hypothetical protein